MKALLPPQPPLTLALCRPARRPGGGAVVLLLCLGLAGCGCDVEDLLAQDSALFWEATETVAVADAIDPALSQSVQQAERRKQEACAMITQAMSDRVNRGEPSLAERLWTGLSEAFVRLVPVPPVERCATALVAYRLAVADLEHRIDAAAVPVNAVLVSHPQGHPQGTAR